MARQGRLAGLSEVGDHLRRAKSGLPRAASGEDQVRTAILGLLVVGVILFFYARPPAPPSPPVQTSSSVWSTATGLWRVQFGRNGDQVYAAFVHIGNGEPPQIIAGTRPANPTSN